ncbi:CAP domain-containing protein [Companilactobacillus sp.]|jgi:uncharacterized protein YkwD|uniref:CAP domain-containing protein n=1 Tax=Companilactobacillus sp. TaxID=2767905 RepID=UPI0025C423AE|nr:CAP domain-containing protein [Companilactobacillus sp.]MCH4009717.1 CAP domain-containing protein [Companilactobacillus sp.]MCH4052607.1 CAP domain-containing protein [Companilactobacillus sp.]MCH4077659.1 CAP domain-containing protein [Companilactobacillus sp.]MCH4126235.1 CAP domain-containing protein [Companilactobacillus sp.]MCI1311943.1 CAP domain-containing protein [Companilactobacillus sp.]
MKLSKLVTLLAAITLTATGTFLVSQNDVHADTGYVGTINGGMAPLYRDDLGHASNRSLADGSAWALGRQIENSQGEVFFQVSTHEYVDASRLYINKLPGQPEYIANFGLAGYKDNGSANNNSNNSSQTTNSLVPSTESVQQAILNSINSERASKGIAPLSLDSKMNQTAMTRAKEIATSFSHTRPDGSSTWSAFPSGTKGSSEENIYMGSASIYGGSATTLASDIMDSFRAENYTPSHYTNVMSSDVSLLGVGVYYNPTNQALYVSEDFIGGY